MPHAKLSDFLTRLKGVKRSSNGYIARCPAHEDKRPSLSITEDSDKLLLYCHAGCSTAEICAVLDIELKDLFFDDEMQKPQYDWNARLPAGIAAEQREGGRNLQHKN